ncbi:MAG: hypothetical protein LBQ63_01765 [Deltaproteobacteria bacterium]|jgi:hypothetical protein|nr:hypothetical protein [Deltaproteobacteria bacterium]
MSEPTAPASGFHPGLPSKPAKFLALGLKRILSGTDPRLLVPLCSFTGMAVWLLPPSILLPLCPLVLLPALAALILLPGGRAVLGVYAGFALFWSLSSFLLQFWEQGLLSPALRAALIFGVRLCCLSGPATALGLAVSPLTLGRVLVWYMQRLGVLEAAFCALPPCRGILAPKLAGAAWRCGLTLAVMAVFLPRSLRVLAGLRRSLRLRAPGLAFSRRCFLLGLSALRLLSVQTWELSLSIASRDLYRPQPWAWRKTAPLGPDMEGHGR